MTDAIPLWPAESVRSDRSESEMLMPEPWPHRILRNVSVPTLEPFLPDAATATGIGVVICPGGAHHILAIDHEGYEVAQWLQQRGIAAFVLKYRVLPTPQNDEEYLSARNRQVGSLAAKLVEHWPTVLSDGERAVDLVRERAAEWALRDDRIGIIGFSAGAHLAVGVALANNSALNFVGSIYGALWSELDVPAGAPPLFIAGAVDDAITAEPSPQLFEAWRKAQRPVEMHMYERGGHGFGMIKQGLPSDLWIEQFHAWLSSLAQS
jgi:acetyl esterase/lipase